MNLAENLQLLRKKACISQEELAEKCQVSRQAIAKWETGDSVPTLEKIIMLADIYNVTLDELVGRISFDSFARFKEYVLKFKAEDIPDDKDDDFSPVIYRFLLFTERMGLDATDRLNGLMEIFLENGEI